MGTLKECFIGMSEAERGSVAAQCKTSPAYLYRVISGKKKPGGTLAMRIERAFGFQFSLAEISPELAEELSRSGYSRDNPAEITAAKTH
jgi:hypothetical protein